MTLYELVKRNREILEELSNCSIIKGNLKYLDLYQEYVGMRQERYKMTYIQVFLCEKYKIASSTFYRVIRKLNKEVEL